MLRNYLITAARSLQRRPGPTTINVLGLAAGLAACLLIGLWVQHERSYDRFHPDAERIHRIALDGKVQDQELQGPVSPAPMASTLRETEDVETATRFRIAENAVMTVRDEAFPDVKTVRADSLFLEVFRGFEMLHGSRETALDAPGAVVLTASTAQRLFGRTDVVGESLREERQTAQVTGVLKDVPAASHVHFDAVVFERLPARQANFWVGNNWQTYIKLAPGGSVEGVRASLDRIVETNVAPVLSQFLGRPFTEMKAEGMRFEFFTQPLTDIHLHSNLSYELETNGSITYVYTFSAIALFILLIACINFMNLATARASERAAEVGVRKAMGAHRRHLAGQFLGEAVLTAAGAAGLAIILAGIALPTFNDVAGTTFDAGQLYAPGVLAIAVAVVLGVGMVAGSYPALVLSRFNPARVLKANARHSTGGHDQRLRQGLVVLQFAISIVLIAGTFVVQQQFDFIQQKRLGFDKERVFVVERAASHGDGLSAFVDRLGTLPGVEHAASGIGMLDEDVWNTAFIPDDRPADEVHSLNYMNVSPGFVETLGLDVVHGRSFSADRQGDTRAVMVNEAAARSFGWERAAGHTLRELGQEGDETVYEVIGIFRDFHYQSIRQVVRPLVLRPDGFQSRIYVRTEAGRVDEALASVEDAWAAALPAEPFLYRFTDQTFASMHEDTQRTGQLFSLFSGLALVIACLGLFGLATYTAQRRTREIGIRKALGATATQITVLLNREFALLVGVAFVIAVPVAYLAISQWLDAFAYRIDVNVLVFVGAGAVALVVALLTVGVQAIRAARLDPTTALRGE